MAPLVDPAELLTRDGPLLAGFPVFCGSVAELSTRQRAAAGNTKTWSSLVKKTHSEKQKGPDLLVSRDGVGLALLRSDLNSVQFPTSEPALRFFRGVPSIRTWKEIWVKVLICLNMKTLIWIVSPLRRRTEESVWEWTWTWTLVLTCWEEETPPTGWGHLDRGQAVRASLLNDVYENKRCSTW